MEVDEPSNVAAPKTKGIGKRVEEEIELMLTEWAKGDDV